MTSRIDGEWLYRASPEISSVAGRLPRFVMLLAFDGVRQPPRGRRTREHVGDARQHRFGRQVGTAVVDDGEEQHARTLRAEIARNLQRRRAARQIEQHRHVPAAAAR